MKLKDVDVTVTGLPGRQMVKARHRATALTVTRRVNRQPDPRRGSIGEARRAALRELERQVEAEARRPRGGYKLLFLNIILKVCVGVRVEDVEPGLTRMTVPRRHRAILDKALESVEARAWLVGDRATVDKSGEDFAIFHGPRGRVEVRVV